MVRDGVGERFCILFPEHRLGDVTVCNMRFDVIGGGEAVLVSETDKTVMEIVGGGRKRGRPRKV